MTPEDAAWLRAFRASLLDVLPLAGDTPALHEVEEITVPCAAGSRPARRYIPSPDPVGTVLYLHGGGLVAGGIETHHPAVAQLAEASGCRFVSLDYRLAPEHPWPAGLEDALSAIEVLAPDAVAGDSAGGLLAISSVRLAVERGLPLPRAVVAIYPNADLRMDRSHASIAEFEGVVIERNTLERGLKLAFPDVSARSDPVASPLAAPDHVGFPPILIATAGNDPLRDEAELLAQAMSRSGVDVEQWRIPHAVHGVLQMRGRDRRAAALHGRIADFLHARLNGPSRAPGR